MRIVYNKNSCNSRQTKARIPAFTFAEIRATVEYGIRLYPVQASTENGRKEVFMILAVDIGNSNIVIGCFEDETILFEEWLSTTQNSTALEYTVIIKTILDLNHLDASCIHGAIISSVVPSVTHTVRHAISRLTGKDALVVGPGIKTGLKIQLDNPAQLGSDRVAEAVAAIRYYPAPLIIIDMGTATTISVIDDHENFRGGMIYPGMLVSLESLTSQASQLPHISLDNPRKIIGTNTIDCMKSGIIYSTAAAIDGVADRIEQELGTSCTLISTGGYANQVIPFCRREIVIDEQLVLKGLMTIYNKNH